MENWQIGENKIAGRGKCLLESGEWCDCVFVVGGAANQERVRAHKLILAMASPIFAAMFYGIDSKDNNVVSLPGIQPVGFKAMIVYIYTDELSLSSIEIAMEVYACGMKFKLTNVVSECLNYLASRLWPEDVLTVVDFAKRYGESHLLDQCVAAMCINTDQIITSQNWKNASEDSVATLLRLNFLVIVSELDLFEALLVWAKAECLRQALPQDRKSIRSVAHNLIKLIRFTTFTLREFQLAPGKEEILEEFEIEMITQRLSSLKKKHPLPEGFSEDHNDRVIPKSFAVQNAHSNQRKQLKYCFRTCKAFTQFNNADSLRSSLTFSVDRPILLYGIKVSSQHSIIEGVPTPYSESLSAFLVYPDGTTSMVKQFVRDVNPDSIFPVEFNIVTQIEAAKIYRICVQFNKPGTYPGAEGCAREEECAGIKFSFNKGPSEHSIRSGLIRGIIFSKNVVEKSDGSAKPVFELSRWTEMRNW